MIWWFKSSSVARGKFLTLSIRPPLHNPSSKAPLMIESPTINVVFFSRCPFSVVTFSLATLLWTLFLDHNILPFFYFHMELVFPRFKLFISCWESFSVLFVLLISGAISFLSDSFVSFELSRWSFGIGSGLGCTTLLPKYFLLFLVTC